MECHENLLVAIFYLPFSEPNPTKINWQAIPVPLAAIYDDSQANNNLDKFNLHWADIDNYERARSYRWS